MRGLDLSVWLDHPRTPRLRTDGREYHFITRDTFEHMIAADSAATFYGWKQKYGVWT